LEIKKFQNRAVKMLFWRSRSFSGHYFPRHPIRMSWDWKEAGNIETIDWDSSARYARMKCKIRILILVLFPSDE
jgi:hypothetical protein